MVVKTENKSYFIDARPDIDKLESRIEKIEDILTKLQICLESQGLLFEEKVKGKIFNGN